MIEKSRQSTKEKDGKEGLLKTRKGVAGGDNLPKGRQNL